MFTACGGLNKSMLKPVQIIVEWMDLETTPFPSPKTLQDKCFYLLCSVK